MKRKYAVVTLCMGDVYKEMGKITHPSLIKYANKIDADFWVIYEGIYNTKLSHWEKFQLYDILDKYERVIFLDTDIIVNKTCPNLFDIVPESDIGAFIESKFALYDIDVRHEDRMKKSQEALGNIGWKRYYFNTGVMILSKRHKEIFNINSEIYQDELADQTQINYNVKKSGFWVHDIGVRYNFMGLTDPNDRFEAYIIHYAGKGFTHVYNNISLKIDRIKLDLEILNKR